MFAINSTYYSIVSVTFNDVKIQDELTKNDWYFPFVDKYKHAEGTATNSGKYNIWCILLNALFVSILERAIE